MSGHRAGSASTDLSALIAETERLMSGLGNAPTSGSSGVNLDAPNNAATHSMSTSTTSSSHVARSPTRLTTTSSSTTVTRSYEEHKARVASSAHAAALRSLSPRPSTTSSSGVGRSRVTSPLSPSKLFARSLSQPSHPAQPIVQPSPLSPREQARREMAKSGMKSPRLRSPLRYDATNLPSGADLSSMRATSASPSRFRAAVDAARSEFDSTLRFENLATPATIRPAGRSAAGSPTRFTSARPSALDSSAIRSSAYVHAPLEPWRELNRQLSLHGFSMVHPFPVPSGVHELPWSPNSTRLFRGVPEQAPSAALNTLLANFNSLLAEYGRRGQTIQELMNKSLAESSSHAHCHAELTSLRRVNQQQSARIAELHRSLENSSTDRASTLKNLSGQIEHSAQQFRELENKYSHTHRELQHRSEEVSDLRRKLDEQRHTLERNMREEHDRAQLVIREKEHEITAAQLRTRELERELQECQVALLSVQTGRREDEDRARDREKQLLLVQELQAKEYQEKIHAITLQAESERLGSRTRLAQAEADWSTRVRSVEDQLTLTSAQVTETQTLNNLLRADLTSTQAQTRAQEDQISHLHHEKRLQSELISSLEEKVAGLQAQAIHGYNVQELTRYLNSFQSENQLVRRDQLGSSFDVVQVHSLPKEVLAELVLLVCMKLKITDATSIGHALDQLISVASAVPGMQEFIAQIWAVVNGANASQASELTPDNLIALTTSVIPTLRSWQHASAHTVDLQRFRLDILDALRRRVHRSPLNPLHSASGAGSAHAGTAKLHDDLPNEEIVFEVNDIVSNENRLNALVYDQHASPTSFFQLWAQMDRTPLTTQPHSQDPEKIISHIQQLFDIPHRIGLFPKMNELFLFVNETRPAIQAMRSLLRLDSRATIHTCIKALKRLVEGQGLGGLNESMSASRSFSPDRSVRHESNGRGLAWTVTSPSKTEQSFLASQPQPSAPSKDQMQRNAQYWGICKQLKTSLGVKKMSEIVGAVAKLQSKSQPDYLSASILSQLVGLLEVSNMTELPSAVQWLREQHAMLQRRVDSDNRDQSASRVKTELSHQLAAKRDEFIGNLKQIVGISSADSDAMLVDTLTKLTREASSSSSFASASAVSSSEQKQKDLIVTQLRGYLGVTANSEIVNTVRTLINRMHEYDELLPQLDSIIRRLYDLLEVNALDDIVPAVRRLVSLNQRPSSGPLAQSSATSSVRGVRDSVENSPTLSSISDITAHSTRSNSTSGSQNRGLGVAASPGKTTTTRTSSITQHSSHTSLYIDGKSPYRVAASSASSSSGPGAGSRVTFDRAEESDLSAYAPGGAVASASERRKKQREEDAAAVQRQLDEAIDRTLSRG